MVTVLELVQRPELDLQPIHLPDPGSAVRWVATSELPDPTPFLEGGEVLLTTGLGTAEWDEDWGAYVDRLAVAGVRALGLAVGLTHDEAPPALVAACRARVVNLFTVPRATRFVAISHSAAELLQAERDSTMVRSFEAQRSLTQAALDPDGVTALTARLAELVGGAAALIGRDGAPTHGPFGPGAAELDLHLVRQEVARMLPRGRHAAASSTGRDTVTVVRPLGLHDRPEVWLAAVVPHRLDDHDRVAMSTAGTLLGLALERRHEQRRTGRRLRTRAVELLLADEPRTTQIVLGAAAIGALAGPGLPRRLRILRAAGADDTRQDALAALEHESLLAALVDDQLVVVAPAARAAASPNVSLNAACGWVSGAVSARTRPRSAMRRRPMPWS